MTAENRPAPPLPSFITSEDARQREFHGKTKRAHQSEASSIDVDRVDRNINESLRRQIVEIINKHPDLALSIIRGWKDQNGWK